MLPRKPWRRRGRRGGQVDPNPALMQEVHHPIEPGEIELAFGRFQPRPGEDAQRDKVDARLLHQADVLVPYGLRPLIGVVVAAVRDVRKPVDVNGISQLSNWLTRAGGQGWTDCDVHS